MNFARMFMMSKCIRLFLLKYFKQIVYNAFSTAFKCFNFILHFSIFAALVIYYTFVIIICCYNYCNCVYWLLQFYNKASINICRCYI